MKETRRRRDRTATQLRAARRRKAIVYLPPGVGFRKSIDAFPGKLSEAGQFELAMRLWTAGCQAAFGGKLGIEETDRKKLRAIVEPAHRKLVPLMKRYPIIAQHTELPLWLTVPQRKAEEPHTVLLHGIFTAYEETRQRHPDCKAPTVGLNKEFRKFLDAVLINFGLGPIGDKRIEGESRGPGMIGEGDLRGAWRRWSGRTSKRNSRSM